MAKRRRVSRETKVAGQVQRSGLPPGTLIDKPGSVPAELRLVIYSPQNYSLDKEASIAGAAASTEANRGVIWLHFHGTPSRAQLEELGARFEIHPLTLEDIQSAQQQAKLEPFENYVHLQCQQISRHGHEFLVTPFHIILREGLVISVAAGRQELTGVLLDRIQNEQSRLRRSGAEYLVYALLDLVVDQAFPALQGFTDGVERLEEELLQRTHKGQLAEIQQSKRDLILFNHVLWPMQEMVSRLNHSIGEHRLLPDRLRPFLNDLYDHTIQLMSLLNSERDVVSGLMDIYLSMVNNRLSDIMRVLTIISTIFIPLTFITGIYGMNIDGIPLLHFRYGFAIVVAAMWLVALAMIVYFAKRGWIFQRNKHES
ncbi:magnesium/cobalt transporter CorA [Acidithiobacillus sp. AMEEHan]|uniref:magnesium/cobalt transporter CorA n=1 Tax=Acidithiobacillus sp. AMEEHan TaxID=2994951 RepID=UPI0027E46492|nr:magnesium/cobalt transporter CorA [Acidithiobacillus sp. AMEEHan]